MNKPTIRLKKPVPRYLIGIDEVGRGPIAGPVAVGAFCIPVENLGIVRKLFRGVRESKQLSESVREEWFSVIQVAQKERLIDYRVSFQSERVIDGKSRGKGLAYAIRTALEASLGGLSIGSDARVLLDGGLKAPAHYLNQKTIIKGDEKEIVIALASICAKVLRDRKMNALATKHPQYGFEKHKGYGTKGHYAAIKKYGILSVHRRSFLKISNYSN